MMENPQTVSHLNNFFSFGGYPESDVLDLCVRSRKRPPTSPPATPPMSVRGRHSPPDTIPPLERLSPPIPTQTSTPLPHSSLDHTPPQSLSPHSNPFRSPASTPELTIDTSDGNNNEETTKRMNFPGPSVTETPTPFSLYNSEDPRTVKNAIYNQFKSETQNHHQAPQPPSLSNQPHSLSNQPPSLLSPNENSNSMSPTGSYLDMPTSPNSMCPLTKTTRPFKAYTKSRLHVVPGDAILNLDMSQEYQEYKEAMLKQMNSSNATNKNMRRNTGCPNSTQNEDPTYWEKRRKNNEAAKRSRDARRAKEDEIAIRCSFLERENMRLKYELAALQTQWERARMFYNFR